MGAATCGGCFGKLHVERGVPRRRQTPTPRRDRIRRAVGGRTPGWWARWSGGGLTASHAQAASQRGRGNSEQTPPGLSSQARKSCRRRLGHASHARDSGQLAGTLANRVPKAQAAAGSPFHQSRAGARTLIHALRGQHERAVPYSVTVFSLVLDYL